MQPLDPEGRRLPVKIDTTSNGEYLPSPLSFGERLANHLADEAASAIAKRLGLSRRRFLTGASGAAATLIAMNEAFARTGDTGGFFDVPEAAPYETELAEAAVGGNEFIFDVQGHHVNPHGEWRSPLSRWNIALRFFPQARCNDAEDAIACIDAEHFIKEVFLDSDTDLAVLSMVPSAPEDNPLSIEDAAATRAMVEAMEGDHRLFIHGLVHPQIDGALDFMDAQAEKWKIVAWKSYTQWGPDGTGFFLDDPEYGIPFIEKARATGIKTICVHKGLPLFNYDYEYSTCRDIGKVAKMFPDVTFIIYHSGYETDHDEGPYDPADNKGVNTLITSLIENDVAPNSNVYAELGSTWRNAMSKPTTAAHLMGKLLTHVGENRVLWGTDSIWYGSPQDQIQAFRAFQIAPELREAHGYPEVTAEIKAKVFGLNAAHGPYRLQPDEIRKRAANDRVERERRAYRADPDPSFQTYGPRTRREFFALLKEHGGHPSGL